jgi:hypothetical protein
MTFYLFYELRCYDCLHRLGINIGIYLGEFLAMYYPKCKY